MNKVITIILILLECLTITFPVFAISNEIEPEYYMQTEGIVSPFRIFYNVLVQIRDWSLIFTIVLPIVLGIKYLIVNSDEKLKMKKRIRKYIGFIVIFLTIFIITGIMTGMSPDFGVSTIDIE